jgi:hypothetical protein
MRQEIDVYKNGECVEHKECPIAEIADTCYALCKKHNVHQIDYVGNKQFGQKIEEKVNLTKYDNFAINFNYY